jgi:hypothetical protein
MGYTPLNVIIAATSTNTQSTQSTLINDTGSTIFALTPIRVNGNGTMETIDVSIDSSALSVVGITTTSVSDGVAGIVLTQGRILDITTSFAVGDYVYVSTTGTLTNVLPSDGVNSFTIGDFIIRIGVVAKNELDSNKKDLFVNISVAGQL